MKRSNTLLLYLIALTLCACSPAMPADAPVLREETPAVPAMVEIAPAAAAVADVPATPSLSEKDSFVIKTLERMTLEEKIGQMFIISFETDENGAAFIEIDETAIGTLEKYKPGGVIYFASNIDTAEQTSKLSADFQKNSKTPLFIAVDEEGGRVSRITRSGKIDAAKIPPAKQIGNTGDSREAYKAAQAISGKLKELGINVDFAPCADLNTDNEGVIGDRAYSGDPETAAEFVRKAVEGFTDSGIICSAKHFPGHGIAPGDTHDEEIISEKRLNEIIDADVIPFTACAEAGVPMIMLSHITVPEWGAPASLSDKAVGYIRNEMNYNGIIITDSLRMGAITNYYSAGEAAVMAVNAGVNILLMPENTEEAFESVLDSVRNGQTGIETINTSVSKILSLKYDYGLID